MHRRISKFIPTPERLLPNEPHTDASVTPGPAFNLITPTIPGTLSGTITVPTPTAPPVPPQYEGKTVEELLAEARRQEKDKLYPQLEQLRGEVAKLTQSSADREASEAEARAEAERLAEEARQSELSLEQRIAERDAAHQAELAQIRSEMEQRDALLERERQYQELESYRQRRIAEVQDDIIPDLLDMVFGSNEAEIEDSIARLTAKSASIIESAAAATQQVRQSQPGVALTGQPPVGPMDTYTDSQSTLSADDIRNMPWSEYVKNRPALLGQASAQRNRGLFG